jgi:hypothetical protein
MRPPFEGVDKLPWAPRSTLPAFDSKLDGIEVSAHEHPAFLRFFEPPMRHFRQSQPFAGLAADELDDGIKCPVKVDGG